MYMYDSTPQMFNKIYPVPVHENFILTKEVQQTKSCNLSGLQGYGTINVRVAQNMLALPTFLCLLLSHSLATPPPPPSFQAFVATHTKTFASPEEYQARQAIYQANAQTIIELRKLNPKATFDLNTPTADLTLEEFRARNTGYLTPPNLFDNNKKTAPRGEATVAAAFDNLAVQKIDWRELGAVDPVVYTQGECGCCWAISVTQTVGSQYYLKKNLSTVPSLSFQQLICCDCGTVDAGCHGGDPHTAYQYIQNAGGVETNQAYPFTDSGPDAQSCNLNGKCNKCKYNPKEVAATITSYVNVTSADRSSGNGGNETKLAEHLGEEGPISVCIDSDPWRFYSSGILTYGARNLNHCVQLIGFDATYSTKYWILKNSWGSKWGESGYIRMEMGMDVCGVADVATMPLI